LASYETYHYQSRPPRRGGGGWLLVLLVVIAAAVGLTVGRRFFPGGWTRPAAEPRTVAARGDLASDEKSTIELFRKSSPSVVHITSLAARRDFFGFNVQTIPQGTGTGFVWDEQGNIVTNFHVVANADAAQVTLADHSTWDAALVGVAPDRDLAVLRIKAPREKTPALPIGTSTDLLVGQKVFAIGNPFGLDQTLTTGIISALGREIDSMTGHAIRDVVQTDAAINPGNSGGPLLDSAGRLIGVNTAIASPSGAYAGVGFAIPVDTVNRIVPDLVKYGKSQRPGLGVDTLNDQVGRQVQQRLGLDHGVVITGVASNSAAARAGLRPAQWDRNGYFVLGDVIVAVNGKKIAGQRDLSAVLDEYKIGDAVTLTIIRERKELKVAVTLQAIG
jgi:S1-C subfamily serine protease